MLRSVSVLPQLSMSLALTFAALRSAKPAAKAIVWPRMDQKSCLKAIVAAGFTPIVVENLVEVCAGKPLQRLECLYAVCLLEFDWFRFFAVVRGGGGCAN